MSIKQNSISTIGNVTIGTLEIQYQNDLSMIIVARYSKSQLKLMTQRRRHFENRRIFFSFHSVRAIRVASEAASEKVFEIQN